MLPAGRNTVFERLVEVRTPNTSHIQGVIRVLLDSWHHLNDEIQDLDKSVASHVCKRLMSVPCVGPTTVVALAAVVDDPSRFASIKDIGPYLGLKPRKYQSGDVDRQGSISKTGCHMTRHLLFEAAGILITRLKKDCALRHWAMALVSRIGRRKATVAAARNQIGSLDFMSHILYLERGLRTPNMRDEGLRETLTVKIDNDLPTTRLVKMLE